MHGEDGAALVALIIASGALSARRQAMHLELSLCANVLPFTCRMLLPAGAVVRARRGAGPVLPPPHGAAQGPQVGRGGEGRGGGRGGREEALRTEAIQGRGVGPLQGARTYAPLAVAVWNWGNGGGLRTVTCMAAQRPFPCTCACPCTAVLALSTCHAVVAGRTGG